MEETERSDGFSRDDTEEFIEAWIHGRIPKLCRKPVFLVFYVRNIIHPCILCLTYSMFTLLSRVVYISQLCRLHNSVIPQTYPKIRKLNSSTLRSYIEDHLINIKWIQINWMCIVSWSWYFNLILRYMFSYNHLYNSYLQDSNFNHFLNINLKS